MNDDALTAASRRSAALVWALVARSLGLAAGVAVALLAVALVVAWIP